MDRRKRRHIEQYNDMVARLLPEKHMVREDGVRVLTRTVTFQVTEDCNLACFVAGTQILMADYNYKPIEDIRVGDMVLGFPEEINESSNFRLEPTRVTRLYSRKKQIRRIITNNGDSVICTDEHPFLNAKRKWVQAKDLFEDSVLIYFDRKNMKLDTCLVVSNEVLDEVVDVYNLETEVHTYVAGNYLVHNCTYCVSGDTEIQMHNGDSKAIKDIQIGDEILAFPECPNGEIKPEKAIVDQLFYHVDSNVLLIEFESGNSLKITENHKVLIEENGFDYTHASNLRHGDSVWIYNNGKFSEEKVTSITSLDEEIPVYNIGTSTHTYIANGIAVHNCYQGHKTKKAMSWETAKKAVDMLLSSTEENNPYINPTISPGIIIEFIGGEPFLEIELIDKIVDYFKSEARRLQHPWAEWFCISICSNGVLYFDDRVQRFLIKNRNNLSFSVTIDGNKELHDSCRVFHDGKPSYDIAVAAAMDWMSRGYYMGSKITIAPGNVSFLYEALKHMIDLGYVEINANCVYEEGWEPRHAIVLYEEMKRISDYLFEHDLENEIFISLFEDTMFKPMDEEDNQNWCGGDASMLCIDPYGNYSICIRFLPSSLGDDQPPIYLGNVDRGLVTTEEEKQTVKCMQCITRRSQSTDECFYCPIARGCAWCFREGTMITTPDGFKAIKDISVGDLVITGSGNTKPVESINKRYTEDTVLIRATGCEPIYTTGEHPFLVRKLTEKQTIQLYGEPAWVNASDVKPYDKLAKTIDGKDIEWVNVREVNTDIEPYEVYNMSVADDHTYIANGAIVHNCSAYNYQVTGSVDQRVTYICIMHKARSLANAYFWNKYYRKHGGKERFEIHCPDDWALDIISQDELDMLKELSKED